VALVGGLLVWLSAAWSLRNAPALAVAKPTPTATTSPTPTTPPALATPKSGVMEAAAGALSLDGINPNLHVPSSLEVVRGTSSLALYRVVVSPTSPDGAWTPELKQGVAAWVRGTVVNVAFCVPQGAPAVRAGDQLVLRLRSGEARAYTVHQVRDVPQQAAEVFAQRRAGITVVVCAGGDMRRIWEGRFDGHADGRMFDGATTNISPTAGARDLELQVLAGYHVRQPDGTPLLAIGLRITNPTDRRVDVRADDVTVYDAMGSKLPVVHPLGAQLPAKGSLDHVLTLRASHGTQVYVRSAGPFGARAWHIQLEGETP
jgi:hypothetical protein